MMNKNWESPRANTPEERNAQGRVEKDPDDPHDRWWVRENWSIEIAREHKDAYGGGPYPWRLNWPFKTRRPRCSKESCGSPVLVIKDEKVVFEHCRVHISQRTLIEYGYSRRVVGKNGLPYADGVPRIVKMGLHKSRVLNAIKPDKKKGEEAAAQVRKNRASERLKVDI